MAVPKIAVSQKLADLYEANEMLWDLSHKDYHNKVKRAAVLQEIGLEIGTTGKFLSYYKLLYVGL